MLLFLRLLFLILVAKPKSLSSGYFLRFDPKESVTFLLNTFLSAGLYCSVPGTVLYSPRSRVYMEVFPSLLKDSSDDFPSRLVPVSDRGEVLARKSWIV